MMLTPLLLVVIATCCIHTCIAHTALLHHKKQQTSPSLSKRLHLMRGGDTIELNNVLYDSVDAAFNAWEWQNGLGAPSALIAGAVLVTLYDTREEYTPKVADKKSIRVGKLLYRFLLATSFGLEVLSIFVATVTGSALLAHGEVTTKAAEVGYTSCLGLLHHHFELNYLMIQIGFLQGLLNWLGSVVLDLFMPKDSESESAKRMNVFLASCLGSLCVWIIAFYSE